MNIILHSNWHGPKISVTVIHKCHKKTRQATIYFFWNKFTTGTNNFFLIKRALDQKLESPFNECIKNINQFPFNKTKRKYSQVECFNLCSNLHYNQTNPCNCFLKSLDEEPYFSCGDNNSCLEQFNNNFNQIEKYSKFCPLECDQYSYEINLISNKIIFTGKFNYLFFFT